MSDKEIALELLKAVIASKGIATCLEDINVNMAKDASEMYEIIYNKVHSLKD